MTEEHASAPAEHSLCVVNALIKKGVHDAVAFRLTTTYPHVVNEGLWKTSADNIADTLLLADLRGKNINGEHNAKRNQGGLGKST
jgi:hypothetical protein